MDIKQLQYFITVAEEGNFSRAAKRLNISQPAISIAVKNLEKEIGSPLFFSFGRKRALTDEGMCLLSDARELMINYQKTLDDIKHIDSNFQGSIRFGIPPLFGACFFGNLIPQFIKEYPQIKVSIVEKTAIEAEEMVGSGLLDLAMTLDTERIDKFDKQHFTTQKNVVLLNNDHPLAKRESLSMADMRDEKFVYLDEQYILHRQFLTACHDAGYYPNFFMLTSQWDFIMEVVSHSQGISILPKPVYENSAKKNVVAVPLSDGLPYWNVILIRNRNSYFSRACETFYTHISKNFPKDDL